KSMYDREWDKRNQLDSAISLPITILSILVAILLFLIQKFTNVLDLQCVTAFSAITMTGILFVFFSLSISIYWLVGSFNNFFNGFDYRNFGSIRAYRRIEVEELPRLNL